MVVDFVSFFLARVLLFAVSEVMELKMDIIKNVR